MSEEETAVDETATADTSTETGTTQSEDWEKRYTDAQAWGTQASQEAAQLREWRQQIETDPEALTAFLKERGYEIEDDTPSEPPADLEDLKRQLREELMAEIEPVKQTQAQIAQENELAQAEAHATKVFTQLGEKRGFDLDENEQEAVIGRALTMPADEHGMPPFEKAYEALEAIWAAREARAAKKRRPTHTFTPGGVAGEDKPDTSTSEGRVALMLSKLQDTA